MGTDIINIDRISKAIQKNPRFLTKYFTDSEIKYIKSRKNAAETAAGRFAAKEAVSKALGTGFRGFGMIEIEVLNDDLGKPFINLLGRARQWVNELGNVKILVSISHTNECAMATAIVDKED
nr:holo-ACP synthase [Alkalibacter mobilis]